MGEDVQQQSRASGCRTGSSSGIGEEVEVGELQDARRHAHGNRLQPTTQADRLATALDSERSPARRPSCEECERSMTTVRPARGRPVRLLRPARPRPARHDPAGRDLRPHVGRRHARLRGRRAPAALRDGARPAGGRRRRPRVLVALDIALLGDLGGTSDSERVLAPGARGARPRAGRAARQLLPHARRAVGGDEPQPQSRAAS